MLNGLENTNHTEELLKQFDKLALELDCCYYTPSQFTRLKQITNFLNNSIEETEPFNPLKIVHVQN